MARSKCTALYSVHLKIPSGSLQESENYLRRQITWTGSNKFLDDLAYGDVCAATNMTQQKNRRLTSPTLSIL
eukprot:6486315-Amphidinium_carterae.2